MPTVRGSRVTLNWTPTGQPAAEFDIIVVVEGIRDPLVFAVPGTETRYSEGNVPPGKYLVRIRARNSFGVSDLSQQHTVLVGVLFEDTFEAENGGRVICQVAPAGTWNYTRFANWNVTRGTVDLINDSCYGAGPLPRGSTGIYVDLDGSVIGGAAGRLESKTTFSLAPGTYELSFQLAGNPVDANTVTVSLGTLYSESFTLPALAPARVITKAIVVSSPTSAKLVFDHAGGDRSGLLLDNVRLASPTGPPSAPSNLTATVSGSTVTLSWEAPLDGPLPTNYQVEGLPPETVVTLLTGSPATTFTTSDLAPGVYTLRVRALSGTVPGPASNEISVYVIGGS